MKESRTNIKTDDLLVGQLTAMNLAAMSWGTLYKIKPEYLTSFIARMENDTGTSTRLTLPLFKMVLFFAKHLQEHTRSNPELMKAIEEAQIKSDMRSMFGNRMPPEDD